MTAPRPGSPRHAGRLAMALLATLTTMTSAHADPDRISEARYAEPVARYGHFALGRPHEYAGLHVRTAAGRALALTLPEDAVFEDLAPRPVTLAAGGPTELLVIVSTRAGGARLALAGLHDGRLALVAQAEPIGTPNRWLNPVGVADLDGDGVSEVAAVTTPHIGGVLRVYRRQGERLVELAALPGFSNHVYGSPELALSRPARVGGRWVLLVPDQPRTSVRAMAWRDGRLVEAGRCSLDAPVTGPQAIDACADRLNATAPAPGR